jgi:hypothetical protein
MVILGVLSFLPGLEGARENLPPLQVDFSYGLFLGLFAMNIVTKMVLIIFGIAGIAAANAKFTSLPASILFARTIMYVMGLLAIFGLFRSTDTLFGLWPLYGNVAWLNTLFAIFGGYFGYALSSKVPKDRTSRERDYRSSVQGTR